jgi:hypothetical protein
LPVKVAFVITRGLKREGVPVPILLFFISIAVVVLVTLALGYGLSSVEERAISRRCRMPHEVHRKRKPKKQRVQCRFEG